MSSYQGHDRGGADAAGTGSGASGPVTRGTTVLRMIVGARLHRHREASGVTMEQAASAIRGTHSKISRLEHGRTGSKQRDVADLLTLYGVTDEAERAELLTMAQQASGVDWWQPRYGDIVPRWLEPYVGLERGASVIRGYEVQFVHGLLQTEDYARAVIRIGQAHAGMELTDQLVSLRLERQKVLTQPSPPKLWAVLDEAALRRSQGGPRVMRGQVERLLELADLPNVTLQVVPFSAGPHAAAGGPFTILRFAEPDLPDVVYLEQLNSALYIDHPPDVDGYLTVMDELAGRAAEPAASIGMLRGMLREL